MRNISKKSEKNPNRVAAGKRAAAKVAARRWVARATGISIGIASAAIMQAHGLPVWLEHGGYLTVAAIICIDCSILYLFSVGGKAAMRVAALGMFVVVAGPIFAVAQPAWDSWGSFQAATTRLDELPEVDAEIRESATAIEIMYQAKKITLAQPLRESLEKARARRAELLRIQAEEANVNEVWQRSVFAGLHIIVIIVMQLSAAVCVRQR
jgi:hypothetical protein